MEIARHWRLAQQRYQLKGSACACCGKVFFAARPVCDDCQRKEAEARRVEVFSRDAELDAAVGGD